MQRTILSLALVSMVAVCAASASAADKAINFSRDIQPILAEKCFACHGPDAKEVQADLRLDLSEVAINGTEGKGGVIVPGNPEKSELVRRVLSKDETEVMPPVEFHKELSTKEKSLLKQWVSEGAEYARHWSFVAPQRSALPPVNSPNWVKNPIDSFVLARLESEGMTPSEEANRETLIRRVSLDLRGFPPSLEDIDEFLADSSPKAYERMVDRMLASPHFGEKIARIWMDLARYGDTNGYHYDSTRQAWLWRDWVIDSYNNNMPFNEFTTSQLAGDLLPDASQDQQIASGFNRNTRYNEEGGADPDEWRVRYAVDRTITLGQVWMGMTVGCAECHSHKYDPISQKEFYQLYAFFNSLDEPGAQGHRKKYPPFVKVPSKEQTATVERLTAEVAQLKKQINTELAKVEYSEPQNLEELAKPQAIDVVWIDDDLPAGASPSGNGNPAWNWVTANETTPVYSGTKATRRHGVGLNQHYFIGAKDPLLVTAGDSLFAYVWLDPTDPPQTVQLQFNDGNWEHRAYWGANKGYGGGSDRPANHHAGELPKLGEWVRLEVSAEAVGLKPGAKINGWAFTQFDGTVLYDKAGIMQQEPDTRHLHSLAAWEKKAAKEKNVPAAIKNLLKVATDKRNNGQRKQLREYYIQHIHAATRDTFKPLNEQLTKAEAELKKTEEEIPFQLVSVELPEPRPAYLLVRGDFLKPGEKVERVTPAAFPAMTDAMPRNRLGLAEWLVSGEHPLTARVAVNRYWAQLFGGGIVETVGDFGNLGRYPTNPALLDWLAVEFVDSGWNRKHIIKLMLMSATYRQSSVNDHRHDEIDPENKLLWRSPRFRLPAEEIRDTALKIAGVLSPEVGGPPVFPYQPTDYYKGKQGGWSWDLSKGDDRYRRGMYTFWRRTTPYPTFVIFDAPDRSECTVSRARTNTPLQALVTMNDPQFVESARVFGQRVLTQGPQEADARLQYAFRLAVARKPNEAEMSVLRNALNQQLQHYREQPDAAKALVDVGEYDRPDKLDVVEHAAWTAMANTLLNLDETINRE